MFWFLIPRVELKEDWRALHYIVFQLFLIPRVELDSCQVRYGREGCLHLGLS